MQAAELDQQLSELQQQYRQQPVPTLNERQAWLKALQQALKANHQQLAEALNQDYGQRPIQETQLADVVPVLQQLRYTRKRLKRWMAPSKRHLDMALWPARAEVQYQPKGVVGIIVPWNFPLMLSVGPLINALAAGNRVMMKLSEYTPVFNQQLASLLHSTLGEEVIRVIQGDASVAQAFSNLPFDHLLFTGSTAIGRHVMAAAANNLTPVTLELGGKSPVLIADDCPIALAVARIAAGKCLNSGQICVAPDYVLCPEGKVAEFVNAFQALYRKQYPQGVQSPDLASIINDAQFQRLQQLLADAEQQGARIVAMAKPACEPQQRRLVTHLVTGVNDNMRLMSEEIFGPVLPIVGYQKVEQAIDYINAGARPLALYVMSFDRQLQQRIGERTISGGMAINDTLYQVAIDDAPFGGIGPSGMGHYHGPEGFLTFSHAKTVLRRGKFSPGALLQAPYGRWWQRLILRFLLR
ncbi:coniferyl aldehyde dehydrogenase [Neiella sp. HB171785]|uniref:Aldehyde dehydrogenase n=1 Tax=Neiella litorisoli TaxID=2771431 RepID=A0A8J6UDH6_9GAMM|nr:coniferyl aldehyde dehydrogenase [Neiella litorisoli]MBD1387884.1 coniferyl aldehyde dehydrogenase [Neiella litorisoli]